MITKSQESTTANGGCTTYNMYSIYPHHHMHPPASRIPDCFWGWILRAAQDLSALWASISYVCLDEAWVYLLAGLILIVSCIFPAFLQACQTMLAP